jgi:hypothetical protein
LREGGKPIPWNQVKAELGLHGLGKGESPKTDKAKRARKSAAK